MPRDLPGRPGFYRNGSFERYGPGVAPIGSWLRGVAAIGEPAMSAGAWSTVGGGWPIAPAGYGVIGQTLWSLPRQSLYSEVLNQRADAYGAAVGAVPTRQLVYQPPRMPEGLNRRAAAAWRSSYGFQLPLAIEVPAVGINNPVLAGSREDPRGPRRPSWR